MSRAWYVAPALDELRDEINLAWPGRDRSSDGAIGDPSHQARKSDHNPDWAAGGVVRARDFDVDGIDVDTVVAELLADDRTRYVIFDHRIAKRYGTGFRWEPYNGVNPHTGHVHVSVRVGTKYENDRRPWGVGGNTTMTTTARDVWAYKNPKVNGSLDAYALLSETHRRVTTYLDAKVSETLGVTRAIRDRVNRYSDSKSSETLALVRDITAALDAAEADADTLAGQINPDHFAGGKA